jgi:tetratricopeptide (TPR) repeat protein
VSAAAIDAPYTLRSIEEMLGLGRGVVASLIHAGFVSPTRGARNEYRFTFQDVVLLRTAHHLRSAKIPPRRLLRSLQQLKAKLPAEMPLTGLRIRAMGNDVAVRNADAQWEADSGQLLMDFEVASAQGTVSFLQRGPLPGDAPARTAEEWFSEGEQLEGADRVAAEAAYRGALATAPGHAHAALNLGALLCENGRGAEAIDLYDRAIALSPEQPLLHFNRAIALEDQHRDREALSSYQRCLQLAPDLADAHFNAARLHDKLGERQGALRHYSAYRRLSP